jgi:imidazolonepropionase-like amidohydrolase
MKLAAAVLTTVLLHANVIDVRDGSIARDVAVTITGNRIVAITPSTAAPADAKLVDATLVDATGKYVIPGLWDMHVHWFDEHYLPLFIANGVTGVRQMWGFGLHQRWRERIARGELVGPRQVIASPIIDGPQPIWPGSVAVKDAAEARAAVAAAKAARFDFIKVYSLLPRDAFLAIAEEAGKAHLPFAGQTYARQLQIVGAMSRAGVRIVAGTDVGNPYCFPGFSLHDELALLVEAGLSPLQALQAATANAAELTGSPELGAVAAGKLADLVVLDANPLADIHNTTKIAAVVFDGRYYPREALAQMLAAAEKLASRKSCVEPPAPF